MSRLQVIARAGCVLCVVAVGVCVAPSTGRAADAPLAVRFEYSADDGCPDEKAFLAEVNARTTRLTISEEPSPAIVIKASLRKSEGQGAFLGTLVFVRGPSESAREVQGASCQEIAEALAIVLAMALDPERDRPRRLASTPAPEPPPPAPPLLAPTPLRVTDAPPQHLRAAAGLGAGVTSAIAPWPAWYGELALELRHARSTPAGRVSLSYAGRRTYETEEGSSSFRWLGARVEGCFVSLAFTSTLAFEPWIGFEAGAIGVSGRTPNGSASHWIGWAASDATFRLRWTVAEPVTISLAGGGVIPLVRNEFYLMTQERTVFQPPSIGLRAAIEADLHFW